MIKNALLVFALFSLIGLAWLLEGDLGEKLSPNYDGSTPIVQLSEPQVMEIHLPKVKISREKHGLIVKDISLPVDKRKVSALVEKLSGLRSLKTLNDANNGNVSQYFAHQDHFILVKSSVGEIRLRLGDVSEVTGNFYVQLIHGDKQSLHIVKDTSFFEGFYKNELEANLRKYLDLKDLVSAKPIDYADKSLFGEIDIASAQKLKVDNRRNRWFELDLVNETTTPAPPRGIRAANLKELVAKNLETLRFASVLKLDGGVLDDGLSRLELQLKNENKACELFGVFNGRRGLFAKLDSDPDRIYELEDKGGRLFFETLQSFWRKVPDLGPTNLSTLQSLDFSLGADKAKLAKFRVPDLGSFTIAPGEDGIEVKNQEYFNLLFNVLFSGNGFEQAGMANQLSEKELGSKIAQAKSKIFLNVFGKRFVFILSDGTLTLLDEDNLVELVYRVQESLKNLSQEQFFAFKDNRG